MYIPIYFTYETEELNEICEQLKQEYENEASEEGRTGLFGYLGINQNLLHFSLNANEPKKIESITNENFYGFLEGSSGSGRSNHIIAIVTNYDSFSILPDHPNGVNSNGSGMIAILELIRILSKFYESYENVIKFDLLFLLTSGGGLNFEGTQHFISNLDSSVLDNIQYVLCLDSLGNIDDPNLYLHLSRIPNELDQSANRLYKVNNLFNKDLQHYFREYELHSFV